MPNLELQEDLISILRTVSSDPVLQSFVVGAAEHLDKVDRTICLEALVRVGIEKSMAVEIIDDNAIAFPAMMGPENFRSPIYRLFQAIQQFDIRSDTDPLSYARGMAKCLENDPNLGSLDMDLSLQMDGSQEAVEQFVRDTMGVNFAVIEQVAERINEGLDDFTIDDLEKLLPIDIYLAKLKNMGYNLLRIETRLAGQEEPTASVDLTLTEDFATSHFDFDLEAPCIHVKVEDDPIFISVEKSPTFIGNQIIFADNSATVTLTALFEPDPQIAVQSQAKHDLLLGYAMHHLRVCRLVKDIERHVEEPGYLAWDRWPAKHSFLNQITCAIFDRKPFVVRLGKHSKHMAYPYEGLTFADESIKFGDLEIQLADIGEELTEDEQLVRYLADGTSLYVDYYGAEEANDTLDLLLNDIDEFDFAEISIEGDRTRVRCNQISATTRDNGEFGPLDVVRFGNLTLSATLFGNAIYGDYQTDVYLLADGRLLSIKLID